MSNINLIEAVRFYINQMIKDCDHGMKGLILDKETTPIVSMVYAQSDLLQKEVFLFERIDLTGKKSLKHFTGIYFVRPIEENIQALLHELQEPKYGNYFIYFTNTIDLNDIKSLAEADEYECVRAVQVIYADYLAIAPHLYSLNTPITHQKHDHWNETFLHRTVQGLTALLFSIRRRNAIIRYQKSSHRARILAEKLSNSLTRQVNFASSNANDSNQTIILIVDRREDPVTPLLNQWTYQAMIHELFGIKNNHVNLSQIPGISKDLEEVVMNAEYDDYYAKNLYNNFGEIATNIKDLIEHYQEKHKSQSKIESINDMKTFIENYPQFKKLSGTVSKHVTIISELSRLVALYRLLDLSEIEQNLVCQSNHNEIVQKIKALIKENKIRDEDILRLISLYALRYEHNANNELEKLKYDLQKYRKFPEKYNYFIQGILYYGGLKFRQTDLFNTQTPMAITRQFIRGLRGVDNIYTQHVPLIKDLMEQLIRGKLKDTLYPSVILSNEQIKANQQNQLQQQGQVIKINEIIVYVIGGITYEESLHIHKMNEQGARILLGGTSIHNFSSFIDEVLADLT